MKVKLLKTWLKVPKRKVGEEFELNKEAAEYGIKHGLCAPAPTSSGQANGSGAPTDPQELAEQLTATKAELADAQLMVEDKAERIAELEKKLDTANQAVSDLTNQVNELGKKLEAATAVPAAKDESKATGESKVKSTASPAPAKAKKKS